MNARTILYYSEVEKNSDSNFLPGKIKFDLKHSQEDEFDVYLLDPGIYRINVMIDLPKITSFAFVNIPNSLELVSKNKIFYYEVYHESTWLIKYIKEQKYLRFCDNAA